MAKGIQIFFSFYSEEILQFFDSEKYFHTEWTDMKKGNESSGIKTGLQFFGILENAHDKFKEEQNGKKCRHIFRWNKEYVMNYH